MFFWDEQRDVSPLWPSLNVAHWNSRMPPVEELALAGRQEFAPLRYRSTLLSEVTPPMSSENPSAMISLLSEEQFSVCSVHCMPVTRCWICATHEDLSLSILQLQKRWCIRT